MCIYIYILSARNLIKRTKRKNLTNMIIPIKRNGAIEDWAIIDLQGDLKFEKIENSDNQLIGDLHFTKAGVPILIIGIHVLHGKEITLEKPLVVLERHRNSIRDETITEEDQMVKTEYIVKAVVKKKLLFKSRPKSIVTNVPKPC